MSLGLLRNLAPASGAAIVALGLAAGPVAAQNGAPAAVPSSETEPFSASELLKGKKITEAECEALPSAVWVVADGQRECIRYYHSVAGGSGSEVIITVAQDVVSVNGRGEARAVGYYSKVTPAQVQDGVANWSRQLGLPYVRLSRPGTWGSSGDHGKRRTPGEIALMSAALDAIKLRHGYTRLHLAGWSTGGHGVAALLARRADLGCVVLSSALVSVRARLAEFGVSADVTGNKHPVDPIDLVDQIKPRPELRIFVLTDPDDTFISARSQTAYVKRLIARRLPVRQIFAAASEASGHGLDPEGRHVAAACVRGDADETIVARFQNKVPAIPPDADEPPLHTPALLTRGVTVTESQCNSLRTAAWVRVDGKGYCVRYWISTAGGKADEALVYFHGDISSSENGKQKLIDGATLWTAGGLQRGAHRWSRIHRGPYITIGRPGAFGSSGNHPGDRRNLLEVRVIMAALDVLKRDHGFQRFHLVGQSGGGHTVAALAQKRTDIGCAVMASGVVSVKSFVRDRRAALGQRVKAAYDPIDAVGSMQHQPGRRMIVLSDPRDRWVSFRSQREFVDRVKARGLPILHITASAADDDFHDLVWAGHNVASDCAKGVDDQDLITRHQATPASVARRQ